MDQVLIKTVYMEWLLVVHNSTDISKPMYLLPFFYSSDSQIIHPCTILAPPLCKHDLLFVNLLKYRSHNINQKPINKSIDQ